MPDAPAPRVLPQPLLAVADVERSGAWYARLLAGVSAHAGDEYGRIHVGGELVLQLHRLGVDHHHEPIGLPGVPLGNGVAVWFHTDGFEAAVARSRADAVPVVMDVHDNPNAGHRELWLRDPDGYLVVLSEATTATGYA